MNCKPGDLAMAFRPGPYQNQWFFVLEKAPVGVRFLLPDGHSHAAVGPGCWIVESAGSLIKVDTESGSRLARFAAGRDDGLRPIRDNPGADETLSWCSVPKPTEKVSA